MIQFDPPYKGQHSISHFPMMVHGVASVMSHLEVVCIDMDGVLCSFPLGDVQVDWRFDPAKRTWVSIDDPEPEPEPEPEGD